MSCRLIELALPLNLFSGGQYRSWKKRHFVLKNTSLSYYVKEGDEQPKGVIDLSKGRGVRAKNQTSGLEWPDEAKKNLAFGLAVEGRTYYFYGSSADEVKLVFHALSVQCYIIDRMDY